MNDNARFLVTTALPDRVGILRDVTGDPEYKNKHLASVQRL
jgi:hypothetical protein